MKCVHINIPKALFVLISVFLNNIEQTQMADNHMDLFIKDQTQKNVTNVPVEPFVPKLVGKDSVLHCESNLNCDQLNHPCIDCDLNVDCIYGEPTNVSCRVNQIVNCNGDRRFPKEILCRYCYQTEPWEHKCDQKANCISTATPKVYYRTNCTVRSNVICFGHRTFYKNVRCNWTGGYRWSKALILSITLGGFGADRFYLGHWQEGIGKLFSFGGLGVWTLVDVVLISLHYLGPADGSLYI